MFSKRKRFIFFPLLVMMAYVLVPTHHLMHAQKIGYKLKITDKSRQKDKNNQDNDLNAKGTPDDPEMTSGSFMVASQCPTCNNGYKLDQIVFTGFDKNQGNSQESFFIINNTDRRLTGVALYIDYRTLDGRQLNKQYLKLACDIPPGETRKVDIKSWDTQKSFYYYKSKPSKHRGNPFDIKFDPICYYLSF